MNRNIFTASISWLMTRTTICHVVGIILHVLTKPMSSETCFEGSIIQPHERNNEWMWICKEKKSRDVFISFCYHDWQRLTNDIVSLKYFWLFQLWRVQKSDSTSSASSSLNVSYFYDHRYVSYLFVQQTFFIVLFHQNRIFFMTNSTILYDS